MDSNYIHILSNRYESVSSAQMTKSLGKSVINLYSNIACSALGIGNQHDLECDPFLNTALQRLTCDLHYRFGAFLAPISVDMITSKHYTKNYSPKAMFTLYRIVKRSVAETDPVQYEQEQVLCCVSGIKSFKIRAK